MDQGRVLRLLRGEASYVMAEGQVVPAGGQNPLPDGLPLLAEAGEGAAAQTGFRSGSSSLVIPLSGGWLHAAGVGVPGGEARPSYEAGRVYTYLVGGGEAGSLWGFFRRGEAEAETKRLVEAYSRGLPVVKPLGVGVYAETRVLEYMGQVELMDAVLRTPADEWKRRFRDEARSVEAACLLTEAPSDTRVDELLYGFLHPCVERFLSNRDCRALLRWLGSSLGINLRRLHDSGLSHGTRFWRGGHSSSSSPASHVVHSGGTLVTDLHLQEANPSRDLREAEVYLLASSGNPLPDAEKAAAQTFGSPKPLVFSLPPQTVEHVNLNPYQSLYAQPKESLEEYAEAWIEGVAYGYNRRILRDAEPRLKENGILAAAACKRDLFRLLSLPDHYERAPQELAQRYRRFSEAEKQTAEKRVEEDLSTSRGAS